MPILAAPFRPSHTHPSIFNTFASPEQHVGEGFGSDSPSIKNDKQSSISYIIWLQSPVGAGAEGFDGALGWWRFV